VSRDADGSFPAALSRERSAMSPAEIAKLEHASRSAIAWVPEGYDGRTHYEGLFVGLLTAVGILAVASTCFLAIM
jgi:hypothetical protein